MSSLVRLYPRSWRARYEPEFLDLLETRPPSLRDRIDIVRGAIDARLDAGSPRRHDRTTRLAAGTSIAAGLLWVAWLVVSIRGFHVLDPAPIHDLGRTLSLLAGAAMAASHLSLGHASFGRMRDWGGVASGVAAVFFGITAIGGGFSALLALAGSAGLAGAVAGRSLPVWISGLWFAASVFVLGGFLGLVASQWTDPSVIDLALPYGIVWIVIGLTILTRGVPTPVADGTPVGSGG